MQVHRLGLLVKDIGRRAGSNQSQDIWSVPYMLLFLIPSGCQSIVYHAIKCEAGGYSACVL